MIVAVVALILQFVTTTLSVFDHVVPIKRHLGYTFRYKTKLEKLKKERRQLRVERDCLQDSVHEARSQGYEIHDNVINWLTRVDTTIYESGWVLQAEDEEAKKRCFFGVCPNLKSHYLLGKRADEDASGIAKFKEEKSRFGPISYRPPLQLTLAAPEPPLQQTLTAPEPPPQQTLTAPEPPLQQTLTAPVPPLQLTLTAPEPPLQQTLTAPVPPLQQIVKAPVPGYKAESREELLKRVMEKLLDPNVDMVGLYGMGGIGKTTLAIEVHKQATRDKLFDVVVMTTITAQPELKKIQGEIADVLRLNLDQETEGGRGARLHEVLKEKRALLILDDLWGTLKLEKIGIPTATTNDSNGCKILLTSRILDVSSDMGSIYNFKVCNFKVEDLSKDEAMSLFRMKVDVVEDPKIAEAILSKCRGFPLLIVTMAGLVRNRPQHTWRDSLTQLSRFDNQELEEKVYSVVKLSYDRLVSEETKLIFLLCGICSQSETTILDLLKYCWGLCLFRRYTLAKARDRLNKLIDDLKASSLLLDVDEEGFMKMHDTVREVAIQIACKHQGAFRVVDGEELKEWPFKDDLKNCTKISMPLCRIQELPEDLECPSVEFFLLFLKGGSLNVPDSAFQHTRKLIVLHFKGVKFSPVPNSLFSFTNLRTLCLDDCSFCDVSIIGQLKNLEILSFRGSDLQRLPDEIGQLTQLKLLDLSHCYQLEVIPANVLSKLSALEQLLMRYSFDQWEAQDHHTRSNASLADLEYLSHLNTLEVQVRSAEALTGFSFSEKLERYHIEVITDRWYFHKEHESSKTIVVAVDTNIDILPAIQKLLKETETLKLRRLNAGSNIFNSPENEGFPKLKNLFVDHVTDIQYITDYSKAVINGFPVLESLKLQNLASLVNICHGELASESFGKLRKVTVSMCDKLKYLFSISMVRGLSQLEEIYVQECENMEGIIVNESENGYYGNEAVELPLLESFGKLRKLAVDKCNKLKYLFSISMVRGLSQLEEIEVQMCESMEGIIVNESDNGHKGNEAVELSLLKSFGKLRKVTVYNCNKLKYLFSISMVRGLSQLEKIEVQTCESMEGIIVIESDNGHNGNEAVELPLLKSFGKLRKVTVYNCNKLKYLFSISMVRGLSKLEEIDVQECENMEGIIVDESDNGHNGNEAVELPLLESFGKLRKLTVSECNKLKYLFSISMVRGLSQLEEIYVQECENMEGIIVNESDNGYYGNEVVELPRLRDLTLKYLPQLQGFTSKGLLSLFDETVVLPSLEILAISNCDNFKMLWNDPLDTRSFGKLKKLFINNCHNLLTVFPSNILERFQKLEELLIESCDSIEVIYHLQESSVNKTNDSIAGFQLRILLMKSLRKLVHIWSVDLPETISLKNLCCLVFPQLTELVLDNLPELISFCTDHMLSIEWQQLKFLQATGCEKAFRCTLEQFNAQNSSGKAQCRIQIQHHLFLSEKGFPNCEEMILDGRLFMGMMMQPSKFQLPSLKSLELRSPIGWRAKYLESSVWLHIQRLPNLRELTLRNLQLRELMLYPHEGQGGGGGGCLKALATHPIPNITVTSNDALIRIMNKTELETFATNPYIERVEILSLAPTLVSNFSSLTSLNIYYCDRLISLVTISVATSLVQLKHMNISDCRMLREILAFDDAAATNNAMQENIVFPKLETLNCYSLPSLRGFYMGSYITLEFPSLENVDINDCLNMNVFSRGKLKTPKLEGDLNSTIRELCFKMYYFRDIETLKLDPSFPWLVEQWHCEQLPFQVFEKLKTLVVDNCSCFLFAVPWNLLSSSTTLKSLSIERCDSIENVFDPEKLKNEDLRHVGSVALLEHLHLIDLPKLRNVWNKDPHGILDIRNLQVLKVHNCGSLTELFTLAMALDLVHLRDLEVKQCTSLQVVIKKEEDEQVTPNSTVFPSLVSLYLEYLPSLTSLCSGSYVLNFKGLCKVALVECPNMRISAFTPTTDEGDPRDILEGNDEDSRNYLCFLGCKVEASNIQELKVEWNNLIAMWTASNQAEFLKNLEVLELLHFPKEGLNSVLDLLQKFSKLKKLVLNSSFLKEIVLSSINIKDENQGSSEHLKVLILTNLPCLNHLMVEDSRPIRDFNYPDCLEVSNCNILSSLVLPSVSFETLTTLEVSKCHGLINLIASSAARSMAHLKRMTISECEMVTEIVASEKDDAKAKICFRDLEHLQLRCLPCLTSFCSRDLCFTFPSLEEVIVIECPKMNTFAPNILSAPLVRRVQIMEDEDEDEDEAKWFWEGSLNSTIEELYMEMNS